MACRIGTAGEVEHDFGFAHLGKRGVIWKRDRRGVKIKEKQAEARQRLWGMAPVLRALRDEGQAALGMTEVGDWEGGWFVAVLHPDPIFQNS